MSEVETGQDLPKTDATVAEPEAQTEESTTSGDEVKEPNRTQKRINQLTWEKNEEKRRADEMEARLAALEQAKPDPVEAIKDIPVPNYADFDNDESFQLAMQQYNANTFERLQQNTVAQQQAEQSQAEQRAQRQAYQQKVAEYAATHDGFIEAVQGSNVNLSDEVTQLLVTSDKAGELTHFLAENPDDALRINALPPNLAARELGKIEARFELTAPKKVSDAPTPLSDLSGADSPSTELRDDMDIDEWMAKRRAQKRTSY